MSVSPVSASDPDSPPLVRIHRPPSDSESHHAGGGVAGANNSSSSQRRHNSSSSNIHHDSSSNLGASVSGATSATGDETTSRSRAAGGGGSVTAAGFLGVPSVSSMSATPTGQQPNNQQGRRFSNVSAISTSGVETLSTGSLTPFMPQHRSNVSANITTDSAGGGPLESGEATTEDQSLNGSFNDNDRMQNASDGAGGGSGDGSNQQQYHHQHHSGTDLIRSPNSLSHLGSSGNIVAAGSPSGSPHHVMTSPIQLHNLSLDRCENHQSDSSETGESEGDQGDGGHGDVAANFFAAAGLAIQRRARAATQPPRPQPLVMAAEDFLCNVSEATTPVGVSPVPTTKSKNNNNSGPAAAASFSASSRAAAVAPAGRVQRVELATMEPVEGPSPSPPALVVAQQPHELSTTHRPASLVVAEDDDGAGLGGDAVAAEQSGSLLEMQSQDNNSNVNSPDKANNNNNNNGSRTNHNRSSSNQARRDSSPHHMTRTGSGLAQQPSIVSITSPTPTTSSNSLNNLRAVQSAGQFTATANTSVTTTGGLGGGALSTYTATTTTSTAGDDPSSEDEPPPESSDELVTGDYTSADGGDTGTPASCYALSNDTSGAFASVHSRVGSVGSVDIFVTAASAQNSAVFTPPKTRQIYRHHRHRDDSPQQLAAAGLVSEHQHQLNSKQAAAALQQLATAYNAASKNAFMESPTNKNNKNNNNDQGGGSVAAAGAGGERTNKTTTSSSAAKPDSDFDSDDAEPGDLEHTQIILSGSVHKQNSVGGSSADEEDSRSNASTGDKPRHPESSDDDFWGGGGDGGSGGPGTPAAAAAAASNRRQQQQRQQQLRQQQQQQQQPNSNDLMSEGSGSILGDRQASVVKLEHCSIDDNGVDSPPPIRRVPGGAGDSASPQARGGGLVIPPIGLVGADSSTNTALPEMVSGTTSDFLPSRPDSRFASVTDHPTGSADDDGLLESSTRGPGRARSNTYGPGSAGPGGRAISASPPPPGDNSLLRGGSPPPHSYSPAPRPSTAAFGNGDDRSLEGSTNVPMPQQLQQQQQRRGGGDDDSDGESPPPPVSLHLGYRHGSQVEEEDESESSPAHGGDDDADDADGSVADKVRAGAGNVRNVFNYNSSNNSGSNPSSATLLRPSLNNSSLAGSRNVSNPTSPNDSGMNRPRSASPPPSNLPLANGMLPRRQSDISETGKSQDDLNSSSTTTTTTTTATAGSGKPPLGGGGGGGMPMLQLSDIQRRASSCATSPNNSAAPDDLQNDSFGRRSTDIKSNPKTLGGQFSTDINSGSDQQQIARPQPQSAGGGGSGMLSASQSDVLTMTSPQQSSSSFHGVPSLTSSQLGGGGGGTGSTSTSAVSGSMNAINSRNQSAKELRPPPLNLRHMDPSGAQSQGSGANFALSNNSGTYHNTKSPSISPRPLGGSFSYGSQHSGSGAGLGRSASAAGTPFHHLSTSSPMLGQQMATPRTILQSPRGPQKQTVQISQTLLGSGAHGSVYLGIHLSTFQLVAVKKVHLMGATDHAGSPHHHSGASGGGHHPSNIREKDNKKQLEELAAEIRLMKELQHPCIVRFLMAERQGTTLNLYLEYMGGGSLEKLVERFGPLHHPIVRHYARNILRGLEYLHSKNIIHRDIKPDNILLGANGDVKLSDFGTSRKFKDNNQNTTLTGTPWYMAPEVAKSEQYGTAADIWSFGCTVSTLLTGKSPYHNMDNPTTVMYQLAREPKALGTEILRELKSLSDPVPGDAIGAIMKCLNPDPAERPTAANLLEMPFFVGTGKDLI